MGSLMLLPALFVPGSASAEDINPDLEAYALQFRNAGLESEESFLEVIRLMPGSRIVEPEVLSFVWTTAFTNIIIRHGRSRSDGPISIFYNPLVDVAALVYWKIEDGSPRIDYARSLPGERIANPNYKVSRIPAWRLTQSQSFEDLAAISMRRIEEFNALHPEDSTEPSRYDATFASAASDMRIVLWRLAENARRQVEWTTDAYSWLEPSLESIAAIFEQPDSEKILKSAPKTDASTADLLASFPQEYLSDFALDMILEDDARRLLIGSSAYDGELFLLALCRFQDQSCDVDQFALLHLASLEN